MANILSIKKSSVASKVPLPADLGYGELAINYADGKLYFKNSSNVIKNFITMDEVNAADYVTRTTDQTITGNKTFSNLIIGSVNGSSGTSYRLYAQDTRSVDDTPQFYTSGIRSDLKLNSTDGLNDGGGFHGVLTFRQYASGSDWSGGGVRQLGFTDNHNLWIRGANADTTWSSWTRFLKTSDTDTANTASKVVIRDASGNFSAGTITATLSGNASTATVLQTARTLWGQSFNGSGNLTGSLDVTGIVKLGLQSSSINGTVLLEDRYNSTEGLVSLSTVRSSGGTMLGNGVMHAENATGFVSSTSINFAKAALVIENGAFKFKSVAAATVARGSAVTLTDRMTLDLSGNLSVLGQVNAQAFEATSTPASFSTNGGANIAYSGSGVAVLRAYSNSSGTGTGQFNFVVAGTEAMRIDPSRNVLIGGTTFGEAGSVSFGTDGNFRSVLATGTGGDTLLGAISGVSNGFQINITSGNATTYTWNNPNGMQMMLNSSGNLGLGVTPSAWGSIRAMQIGTGAAFSGYAGTDPDAYMSSNAYWDAAWKHITTKPSYLYEMRSSVGHLWYTAPSGTAGNPISFTQAMTLNSAGNLSVTGNVSSAGTLYGSTFVQSAIAGNTTTATTQFVFATFSTGGFQALEILLSAKQGSNVHVTKLLVTHDTVTAIATEYGTLRTSTSLFNADVDISGGNVRVLITPTSATSTTFKASYNYLT